MMEEALTPHPDLVGDVVEAGAGEAGGRELPQGDREDLGLGIGAWRRHFVPRRRAGTFIPTYQ
jgi:hypothetical protein